MTSHVRFTYSEPELRPPPLQRSSHSGPKRRCYQFVYYAVQSTSSTPPCELFQGGNPDLPPSNDVQTVFIQKQRLPCRLRPYQQTNTAQEHLRAFRAWLRPRVADGRLRTAGTLRRAVWRNLLR